GYADGLLLRVEEQRAADRVGTARDRRDRGGVEAEALDGLEELGLDGGDRLADVARFELGELAAIGGDRVRERVQQPRALGRRRLAPVACQRGAGGVDSAVDVLLAGHGRLAERLARGGLEEVAQLAGRGLRDLTVDE